MKWNLRLKDIAMQKTSIKYMNSCSNYLSLLPAKYNDSNVGSITRKIISIIFSDNHRDSDVKKYNDDDAEKVNILNEYETLIKLLADTIEIPLKFGQ